MTHRGSPEEGQNVVDWINQSPEHGELPAVVGSLTYSQLQERIAELSSRLARRVMSREAALIAMDGSADSIVRLLAVLQAGIVAVPLPVEADICRLRHVAAEICPAICLGSFDAIGSELSELRFQPQEAGGPAERSDQAAVILYTSGTTASPKGVQLSHSNLIANLKSVQTFTNLSRDDVVGHVLPSHFSFGLSMLLLALRGGAAVLPLNRLAPPATRVAELASAGATVFAGVPHHFEFLLKGCGSTASPGLSLRLLLCAGEAMPVAVLEDLRRRFPTSETILMYGQTEATARLSYLPADQLEQRPTSIGKGVPGVTLRVLDENGQTIKAGELGEIYAEGANVMLGYVGSKEATEEVITRFGLKTRDLATIDEDGYIYVRGRRSDFVKVHGTRLGLGELETAAERLPDVAEALAQASHRDGIDHVTLKVRLRDTESTGVNWPAVQRRIRRQLGPARHSVSIESVASIPRTESGKKIRDSDLVPTLGKEARP